MKKYSELDLLNRAVVGNTGQLINRLFESKYVRLSIRVPAYDLKRGQILVGTINDYIENENMELFTIEKLFVLLFEDFLKQVERGMDLDTLASVIKSKLEEQNPEEVEVIITNKQTNSGYGVFDIEELLNDSRKKRNKNPMVDIQIRILRKYCLRTEVLLHDLNELFPEVSLQVEDLIALRYRDVIKRVKEGRYEILQNIVRNVLG